MEKGLIDYPNCRASSVCPCCHLAKPVGNIVCWRCYHRHDFRNGIGPAEVAKSLPKARVLVTVSGGVAEVETSGHVQYELLDFDNLEAEGLCSEERQQRYNEDSLWLKTGKV